MSDDSINPRKSNQIEHVFSCEICQAWCSIVVLSTNPSEKDKYWKKHQAHLRHHGFYHFCDFSEKPVVVETKVWNRFSSDPQARKEPEDLIERDK